jgi:hypothetical protein
MAGLLHGGAIAGLVQMRLGTESGAQTMGRQLFRIQPRLRRGPLALCLNSSKHANVP